MSDQTEAKPELWGYFKEEDEGMMRGRWNNLGDVVNDLGHWMEFNVLGRKQYLEKYSPENGRETGIVIINLLDPKTIRMIGNHVEKSVLSGIIPQLIERNVDPIRAPRDETGVMVTVRSEDGKEINKVPLEAVVMGTVGSIYDYCKPRNATATRAVNILIYQVIMAVERYLRLHELDGSWRITKDGKVDDSGVSRRPDAEDGVIDAWRNDTHQFFNKVMREYEALQPGDGFYT
jgi:hypothetical protein